jgi:hypothetical protein
LHVFSPVRTIETVYTGDADPTTGLPPRSRRSRTVTRSIWHHRTVRLIGYREIMMQNAFASRAAAFAAGIGLMGLFPQSGEAQVLEPPISYNLRVLAPDMHIAGVEATGRQSSCDEDT